MPNTLPTIVVRTLSQSSDWVVDTDQSVIDVGDVVKLQSIDAPAMLVTDLSPRNKVCCAWFTSFGEGRTMMISTELLTKLRQEK